MGGTGFQGHFWILKRAPKNFSTEMLATGEWGKSIPKLLVLNQIFKSIEISKQKGYL
jgi:hypothetical protein